LVNPNYVPTGGIVINQLTIKNRVLVGKQPFAGITTFVTKAI
jgi:hypothetical protein